MVRLRLYQFVVASLMVILVASPFTQQINGLDDFVTNGNDLESQVAGIIALIGLALVTVGKLLPRVPRSRNKRSAPIYLAALFDCQMMGVDRIHVLGSGFELLRI